MLQNVVFDCDSTLTRIEGVDVLASMNDVWNEVALLTRTAMDKASLSVEIYGRRLELIQPNKEQVKEVGDLYIANVSGDAKNVVAAFHAAGKNVHIVTGALQPAVFIFARFLGIEFTRVHSVPIYFDMEGEYAGFDKSCSMVNKKGKCHMLRQITEKFGVTAMIGDGMNDLEAAHEVDEFIGYGGVISRKRVLEGSKYYVKSENLSPVLHILLDDEEIEKLAKNGFSELIERGKNLLNKEVVKKV